MPGISARSRISFLSALGALFASASMACSSPSAPDLPPEMLGEMTTSSSTGLPTTSSSSTSAHDDSLFSGGAGGGLGVTGDTVSTGQGVGGASAACAASPYKAAQLPLDMYIMLDQSKSMSEMTAGGPTKWMAVTNAIQGFVSQQGISDVAVGIQYFGHPLQGGAADSCNASDYTTPEVEIAPLPGVAGDIVSSMSMHGPSTSTPTSAALQGAVDHGAAWAANNPGHVVVAVLATDGKPNECDKKTSDMAATAAAGLTGSPSVKTFAIGVFAPADIPSGPEVLNSIASAGGTNQAFVIDTNDPATDVESQFLAALNTIRGTALGCQYSIPVPTSGTRDFAKVNLQYTPGGSDTPEAFLQYENKASCPATGDGWYYDSNTSPTQILLCDATCKKVSNDTAAAIDVLIGCTTMVAPQ